MAAETVKGYLAHASKRRQFKFLTTEDTGGHGGTQRTTHLAVSPSISSPALELRKQRLRVAVVYLFQHLIGQAQSVNHPAPLLRILRVRKVFVFSLKPAEIIPIHRFSRAFIGPEHDAVGIFQEDFTRPPRLTSKFSFACPGFD